MIDTWREADGVHVVARRSSSESESAPSFTRSGLSWLYPVR
jgi:hypothetical protein